MELYQLKTFIAVANEGHLTRASEQLNASQPTVSSHVKALEEELGVELFVRSSKGMEITPEGLSIKAQAQKVLAEADGLLFLARSLHGEVAGVVKIGLNSASSLLKTDAYFKFMEENHPKLEFHLLQGISGQILRDIRSGGIDAGYVFGENIYPDEIDFIFLKEHKLRIVGPVKWKEELVDADWPELASYPWVWTSHDCPWRHLMEEAFAERGLHPIAAAYTDNEASMTSLVMAGAGMGLMQEDQAKSAAIEGNVSLWEKEKFPIHLSFAYKKNREADPIMQAILAGIKQTWGLA